ncbi:FAD-dependent oxidoreductase [Kribbella pittospori]|uniref:FAD-dependent oxidoreductase n=1 Tax=Kribbella pittospori TaxID=722689 RepID=A0A4R0KMT4_9ACTN|nr:FAD-dependent oxidoreductase [Kribbella pittospori]TCC61127.1 FAD-dependent oxidoreductase [Kribbella pittospori]
MTQTDVVVIGGGLGGVAVALAAATLGRTVVLTEELDWLGGQLTTQAVPPDENAWIEGPYSSASYQRLRAGIRDFYRRNYPLTEAARADATLNPGRGLVSGLCHEPPVAVAVIGEMLAPYLSSGRITLLMRHVPVAVHTDGDRVEAVTVRSLETGDERTLSAPYVVDATELGDLLELGGIEHVVGAESQDETGEPHALPGPANPLDQQAITWCCALEHRPGEDHTIDKPDSYDFWLNHESGVWPGSQLTLTDVDPGTLVIRELQLFGDAADDRIARTRWNYRRIRSADQFTEVLTTDVTLMNWPQNDYWLAPLIGVDDATRDRALAESRELTRSLVYWLQTAVPRSDGGTGYPGLRLCREATGTTDGLAKAAYIRESRRILGELTVTENHLGVTAREGLGGPAQFADSVGIGAYRIDLHPSTSGRTYVDLDSHPFQIPLGALLPRRVTNLLPANKNIGSTHITNGCYRLHPVEWAIGEAVGALAAFCLDGRHEPTQVRNEPGLLADYQRLLTGTFGVPLEWPREIRERPLADSAYRREAASTPIPVQA